MTPARYRVTRRKAENADTATLALVPVDSALPHALPGQFHMLYAFGIGEVPISVSGLGGVQQHTLRAVGAVTRALFGARPGALVGVRGPFGMGWRLPAPDSDLVIIGGGIGLAPLRPVICHVAANRAGFGDVTVAIGARTPADLLYTAEYQAWRTAGVRVLSTVDRAFAAWAGHVGVITTLLTSIVRRPERTAAMICGPEVMMRFAARALLDQGLPAASIQVSLERNMRCGTAECGHCQLGPLLVCRDGPVTTYDVAEPLLSMKEL